MRAVALLLLVACKPGDGPHAQGTLVFDAREAADVFLATEVEVMRSEPIVRRVREQFRTELAPAAITAKRRAKTMLVDVTVRDKDPQRAAELCNQVMQTYLEYRLTLAINAIRQEQQVLGEQLDRDPQNAQLRARLQELETKQMMRGTDVRVLEPCVFKR